VIPEDYFAQDVLVHDSPVKQPETTAPTPTTQTNDSNDEVYKLLWTEHDQKLKQLESMIEEERKHTEELRARVKELEDKLTVVPHPFHNFVTQLYDDDEVEYVTKESAENFSSETDSIPETPISPFIKRRKTESFEIGVVRTAPNANEFTFAKKRSSPKPKSTKLRPSLKVVVPNMDPIRPEEVPFNLGSVDLSLFVRWNGEIYCMSKAFPSKHLLMKSIAQYEIDHPTTRPNILVENEELRLLKQMNKNVLGHSRTISLYTMHFVKYFADNESNVTPSEC
jgi:hypothetical protein